jgi:hypothetical protein
MDDNEISKDIIPLYKNGNEILVGLEMDYPQVVNDGLVLLIDIENKKIIGQPWSGQKIIKHGYWNAIEENERVPIIKEIYQAMGNLKINEIIDILLNPPKSSIESLAWKPERIRNENTSDFGQK